MGRATQIQRSGISANSYESQNRHPYAEKFARTFRAIFLRLCVTIPVSIEKTGYTRTKCLRCTVISLRSKDISQNASKRPNPQICRKFTDSWAGPILSLRRRMRMSTFGNVFRGLPATLSVIVMVLPLFLNTEIVAPTITIPRAHDISIAAHSSSVIETQPSSQELLAVPMLEPGIDLSGTSLKVSVSSTKVGVNFRVWF